MDEPALTAIRDRYIGYILEQQAAHGANDTAWLGPAIPRNETPGDKAARNYWSKYPAIEAFEAYAEESAPPERAKVVAALVAHQRAFWAQLRDADPALNESRWGFARHEDGLLGIEWLLDAAWGGQASPAFISAVACMQLVVWEPETLLLLAGRGRERLPVGPAPRAARAVGRHHARGERGGGRRLFVGGLVRARRSFLAA